MELLIIWLLTILASYSLKLINELKLFKMMANLGYKIDIKKLLRLSTKISKELIITNISMLIPLYNIIIVAEKTIQCNNAKYKILEQSGLIDVIYHMNDKEKEEYSEKPTCLNAAHIALEGNFKETQIEKNNQESIKSKNSNLVERIINKKEKLQNLKQELIQDSSVVHDEKMSLRLTKKIKREK